MVNDHAWVDLRLQLPTRNCQNEVHLAATIGEPREKAKRRSFSTTRI
jgi:hypothetical protein